ncbi:MAG: divalent-cation tolerance protein CutA [Sphingomonadales bacterium]|nr:divalent-cation tolerance protein CutA [Sphingomonadales bacterium]
MAGLTLIYTLCGSDQEADEMCRTLVGEKLAACANRLAACTSYFEWRGEMQCRTEFPILFKTLLLSGDEAKKRIEEIHSYDAPAIISWDVDNVSAQFYSWMLKQSA